MDSKPESPAGRRRSNGIRTRAEIVAAAERHFAERGFRDTRLGDVAAEVGIRRASLSYHFRDKQQLYTAVLRSVFADWSETVPSGGSAGARLEDAISSWIDFVAARPTASRLLLREIANAQPERITQFLHTVSAEIEWIEQLIAEGTATGEFQPKVEPVRFLSLVAATIVVQFAAMPWLSQGVPVDPQDRKELQKRKQEILLVAGSLLGYEPVASRAPASPAKED